MPRDSTPTTHILKPAVAPYPNHHINEYMTMAAARELRLHVADDFLVTTERGQAVFVPRATTAGSKTGVGIDSIRKTSVRHWECRRT